MAKKALSRKQALAYLKRHPEAKGKKDFEDLKTPTLRRKVTEAKAAKREKRAYSERLSRGHAGNVKGKAERITHVQKGKREKWKGAQDQFVVGHEPQEKIKANKRLGIKGQPEKPARPPGAADVLRALEKRNKENKKQTGAKEPQERFVVWVRGMFHNYDAIQMNAPKTLPVAANDHALREALAKYPNITQAMNYLYGYGKETNYIIDPEGREEGWLEVWTVSISTRGSYEPPREESA